MSGFVFFGQNVVSILCAVCAGDGRKDPICPPFFPLKTKPQEPDSPRFSQVGVHISLATLQNLVIFFIEPAVRRGLNRSELDTRQVICENSNKLLR